MKMKTNKLLECYDEAIKEAKEEQDLQQVACFKKKLEEKIGDDKNRYLCYKIMNEGNSFMEPVTYALSIVGIILSVFVGQLDTIIDFFGGAGCSYLILLSIFFFYMIFVTVIIRRYMGHVLIYKKIAIILEEIYKEKFEGESSSK